MTPKEYQKPSLALEVKAAKKRLQEITPLWQLQFALPCRESIAVKLTKYCPKRNNKLALASDEVI